MKRKIKRILLFVSAYILTGIYRAAILVLPYKRLTRFIGTEKGFYDENARLKDSDKKKIRAIQRATYQASYYTPWQSLCMVKALTAMTLLKLFGIRSVMYLGLSKSEKEGLLAHAWLQVGKSIITGKEDMEDFNAITWYVS